MPLQPDTLQVVQDTVIAAEPAAADTGAVDMAASTGEAVDTVQGFVDGFYAALPKVAVALAVFLLFWAVAAAVRAVIHRVTPGPVDSPIGIVIGRLVYAVLLVVGVLVGLVIVFPTFTVGSLLGALGLGGVAFAFAFQDTFQNLLAGVLLLLRQPFRVGDEIVSGEYVGTVEAIETRATFIRTYDGRRVIIPNSQIYSDPVQVITAYNRVRSEYDVGIGYGDDVAEAKRIALETVRGIDGVMEDPGPDVLTWDLAGSSVNLRVRWWTDPRRANVVKLRDRVLMRVSGALLAAGIDLPFPTQQVLFHDQTEATDGDRTAQREGWPVPPDGDAPDPARISAALAEAARQRGAGSGSSRGAPPPASPDATAR
jgi:small-conductance mechanosensitive channel